MPNRSYTAGSQFRYGFNGKENDNDVKGTGNQQDYGMRIYDPRIGRFLSVDPLTKNFPWYTPYQFAGNSPMSKIDLDGGEPKDFKKNWKYQSLFNLNTGGKVEGTGTDIIVTDPKFSSERIDVSMVYDEVTKQYWFVHQNGNKSYYLKNADGNNSVMTLDTKTYEVKGGEFVEFESQDRIQSRLGVELAEGFQKAIFGITVSIAGGAAFAGSGAAEGATLIGRKVAKWTLENLVKTEGSWAKFNLGSGLGDFSFQTLKNKGKFWENNYVSTAGNFFLGALPSGILGSTLNVNFEGGTINSEITTDNWLLSVGVNTFANSIGGILGKGFSGKSGIGLPLSDKKAAGAIYDVFGNSVSNAIPTAIEMRTKNEEKK